MTTLYSFRRSPTAISMLRAQRVVDLLIEEGDFSQLDSIREQALAAWGNGQDPNGKPTKLERPAVVREGDERMHELSERLGLYDRETPPRPSRDQAEARSILDLTVTTVYLAQSSAGPVKIGHSSKPHYRVTQLHYVAGDQCELLLLLPGGRLREMHLHARFREHRLTGEWFRLSDAIKAFIRDHGGYVP